MIKRAIVIIFRKQLDRVRIVRIRIFGNVLLVLAMSLPHYSIFAY